MAQQRTVVGFFDNIVEAQQAVQLVLAEGFTAQNIALSTLIDPKTIGGNESTPSTEADSSSGRFFLSLFGDVDDVQADSPDFAVRRGTLLTVQIQSPAQAKQVADLMSTAGAMSMDEQTDSE